MSLPSLAGLSLDTASKHDRQEDDASNLQVSKVMRQRVAESVTERYDVLERLRRTLDAQDQPYPSSDMGPVYLEQLGGQAFLELVAMGMYVNGFDKLIKWAIATMNKTELPEDIQAFISSDQPTTIYNHDMGRPLSHNEFYEDAFSLEFNVEVKLGGHRAAILTLLSDETASELVEYLKNDEDKRIAEQPRLNDRIGLIVRLLFPPDGGYEGDNPVHIDAIPESVSLLTSRYDVSEKEDSLTFTANAAARLVLGAFDTFGIIHDKPFLVWRGIESKTVANVNDPDGIAKHLSLSLQSTSQSIDASRDFVGERCCMLAIIVMPGVRFLPTTTLETFKRLVWLPFGKFGRAVREENEITLPPNLRYEDFPYNVPLDQQKIVASLLKMIKQRANHTFFAFT